MRRKAGNDDGTIAPVLVDDPEPETAREAKQRWAELLRRILEFTLNCTRHRRCDHARSG